MHLSTWKARGLAVAVAVVAAQVRVRSSISIRWTDGTLSTVSVLGPLTSKTWCPAG